MASKLAVPALVAVVVIVAGCLPSRDNGFDPQVAPNVHVKFVELAHRGPCPAVLPASPLEIGAATRLDCIGIDARETTDPQGTTAFEYSFFLGTSMTPFATNATGLAVIDPVWLAAQAPAVPLPFRITARDPGKSTGNEEVTLTLDNLAPVAVVAAPRAIPLGGYAWQSSTTSALFFDGSESSDPDDGVPAMFCWTFDASPEVCSSDVRDPAFTIAANLLSHHRVVARLRVIDAWGASSLRAVTTVDISSPTVWMNAAINSDQEVLRLDNAAASNIGRDPAAAAFVGTSLLMISSGTGGALRPFDWVTLTPTGPAVPFGGPNSAVGMVYDAAHDALFTVSDYDTAVPEFRAWTTNPLAPGAPLTLPGGAQSFSQYGYPRIVVDGRGDAFVIAADFSTTLWRVRDPAGASAVVEDLGVAANRALTGLGARPRTNETWGIEIRNYLLPVVGTPDPARIVRYHVETDGTLVADPAIALDADIADSLYWVNESEFWIHIGGDGVRLVDADQLEVAGLDGATLAHVPLENVSSMVVDPATGECWAFPSAGFVSVIKPDGRVRTIAGAVKTGIGFDPDGALFFYAGFLGRGFAPGTIAVVDRHFYGSGEARYDPASGGVWAAGSAPPSLLHVGIDGSIDDSITTLAITGVGGATATAPMNAVQPMFLSREGTTAYAFERDTSGSGVPGFLGLLRVDLGARPPRATRILDTGAAAFGPYMTGNANFAGGNSLGLATPSSGSPFFWAFNDATKRYLIVATNGAASGLGFTIPAAEQVKYPTAVATDLSGSLCVATVDGVTPTQTARLRAISPSGVTTLLKSFAVPNTTTASGYIRGVSAASRPAGDVCFIAYSCHPNLDVSCFNAFVGAQIAAYDLNGVAVHTAISVTGDWNVYDLLATSPDEVWTKETNYRNSDDRVMHYRWTGAGWSQTMFFNPPLSGAVTFTNR